MDGSIDLTQRSLNHFDRRVTVSCQRTSQQNETMDTVVSCPAVVVGSANGPSMAEEALDRVRQVVRGMGTALDDAAKLADGFTSLQDLVVEDGDDAVNGVVRYTRELCIVMRKYPRDAGTFVPSTSASIRAYCVNNLTPFLCGSFSSCVCQHFNLLLTPCCWRYSLLRWPVLIRRPQSGRGLWNAC